MTSALVEETDVKMLLIDLLIIGRLNKLVKLPHLCKSLNFYVQPFLAMLIVDFHSYLTFSFTVDWAPIMKILMCLTMK